MYEKNDTDVQGVALGKTNLCQSTPTQNIRCMPHLQANVGSGQWVTLYFKLCHVILHNFRTLKKQRKVSAELIIKANLHWPNLMILR